MERLVASLKEYPDVARWSGHVDRGAIRFYLPLDAKLTNDFFGQAIAVTKDIDARLRLQEKLTKLLAEQFPNVVSQVSPLELGLPWVGQSNTVYSDLIWKRSETLPISL
ncbi:hypothetical protein [Brucella sp. LJL56]